MGRLRIALQKDKENQCESSVVIFKPPIHASFFVLPREREEAPNDQDKDTV